MRNARTIPTRTQTETVDFLSSPSSSLPSSTGRGTEGVVPVTLRRLAGLVGQIGSREQFTLLPPLGRTAHQFAAAVDASNILNPLFRLCVDHETAQRALFADDGEDGADEGENEEVNEENFARYARLNDALLPLLWGSNSADDRATFRRGGPACRRDIDVPLSSAVPSRFAWGRDAAAAPCRSLVALFALAWMRLAVNLAPLLPPRERRPLASSAFHSLDDLAFLVDGHRGFSFAASVDDEEDETTAHFLETLSYHVAFPVVVDGVPPSLDRLGRDRLPLNESDPREQRLLEVLRWTGDLLVQQDRAGVARHLADVERELLSVLRKTFDSDAAVQEAMPILSNELVASVRSVDDSTVLSGLELIGPLQLRDLAVGDARRTRTRTTDHGNGGGALDALLASLNDVERSSWRLLKGSRAHSRRTAGAAAGDRRLDATKHEGLAREKSVAAVSTVGDSSSSPSSSFSSSSLFARRLLPSSPSVDDDDDDDDEEGVQFFEGGEGFFLSGDDVDDDETSTIVQGEGYDVGDDDAMESWPEDDDDGVDDPHVAVPSWPEVTAPIAAVPAIADPASTSRCSGEDGWMREHSTAAVSAVEGGTASTVFSLRFDDHAPPFPDDRNPLHEEEMEEGWLPDRLEGNGRATASVSDESVRRSVAKVETWDVRASAAASTTTTTSEGDRGGRGESGTESGAEEEAAEMRRLLHRLRAERDVAAADRERTMRNNADNARLVRWQEEKLAEAERRWTIREQEDRRLRAEHQSQLARMERSLNESTEQRTRERREDDERRCGLESGFAEAATRLRALEDALTTSRRETATAVADNERLRKAAETLEAEAEVGRGALATLQRALEASERSLEETAKGATATEVAAAQALEGLRDNRNEEVAVLGQALEASRTREEAQRVETDQLRSQVDELRAWTETERTRLLAAATSLQERTAVAEEQSRVLGERDAENQRRLRSLQDEIEKNGREGERDQATAAAAALEWSKRERELTDELQSAKRKNGAERKELAERRRTQRDMKDEIAKLQKAVRDGEASNASLRDDLEKASSRSAGLEERAAALRGNFSVEKEAAAKRREERETLQIALATAETKIGDLKRSLLERRDVEREKEKRSKRVEKERDEALAARIADAGALRAEFEKRLRELESRKDAQAREMQKLLEGAAEELTKEHGDQLARMMEEWESAARKMEARSKEAERNAAAASASAKEYERKLAKATSERDEASVRAREFEDRSAKEIEASRREYENRSAKAREASRREYEERLAKAIAERDEATAREREDSKRKKEEQYEDRLANAMEASKREYEDRLAKATTEKVHRETAERVAAAAREAEAEEEREASKREYEERAIRARKAHAEELERVRRQWMVDTERWLRDAEEKATILSMERDDALAEGKRERESLRKDYEDRLTRVREEKECREKEHEDRLREVECELWREREKHPKENQETRDATTATTTTTTTTELKLTGSDGGGGDGGGGGGGGGGDGNSSTPQEKEEETKKTQESLSLLELRGMETRMSRLDDILKRGEQEVIRLHDIKRLLEQRLRDLVHGADAFLSSPPRPPLLPPPPSSSALPSHKQRQQLAPRLMTPSEWWRNLCPFRITSTQRRTGWIRWVLFPQDWRPTGDRRPRHYDAVAHDAFLSADRTLGRLEETRELIRQTAAFLVMCKGGGWGQATSQKHRNLARIVGLAAAAKRKGRAAAAAQAQAPTVTTTTCEFWTPRGWPARVVGELVKRCCELIMLIGLFASVNWRRSDYQGVNRLVIAAAGDPLGGGGSGSGSGYEGVGESEGEGEAATLLRDSTGLMVRFSHSTLQRYDKLETAMAVAHELGDGRSVRGTVHDVAIQEGTWSPPPLPETLRWKLLQRVHDEDEDGDYGVDDAIDGDAARLYLELVARFLPAAVVVSSSNPTDLLDALHRFRSSGEIVMSLDPDDPPRLIIGRSGQAAVFDPRVFHHQRQDDDDDDDDDDDVAVCRALGDRLVERCRESPRRVERRRDVVVALMSLTREMLVHGASRESIDYHDGERVNCMAELRFGCLLHP